METAKYRPEHRLLLAAQKQIAQQGSHGIGLRSLCKQAGISTSSFHALFRTQNVLFKEVFQEGWKVIQFHVAARLTDAIANTDELLEAVLNGVFDAFEADSNAVGATIILGMTTIGEEVRGDLSKTNGFEWYVKVANNVESQLKELVPNPDEANELAEILFGAVTRRLFLMTPMCTANAKVGPDRKTFIRVLTRTVNGLVQSGRQSVNTVPMVDSSLSNDDELEIGESEEDFRKNLRFGIL